MWNDKCIICCTTRKAQFCWSRWNSRFHEVISRVMRRPYVRTRLLGDYPRLIGRNIPNGRYQPPVFFFMLQRLQRDWGTRDTWTWGRSSWARVYYRWVLLDSFLIRFLVPASLSARRTIYTPFLLSSDTETRSLLPPRIPGMIQPDPRINHLSSKLDNGFCPFLHRLSAEQFKYLPRALQSSLRDIDGRAWIHCRSLDMYGACEKSRARQRILKYILLLAAF